MKIRKLYLLTIALAVLVAACGKKENPVPEGENAGAPEAAVVQEKTEPDVMILSEIDEAESDEAPPISQEQLYSAFLAGERKVHLVPQNEFYSMIGGKNFQQEVWTLTEYQQWIAERIQEEWYLDESIDASAEYAWLDSGNSGKKLLAVRMHFPVEAEEWITYLVVNAAGGELEECFSIDAYYRKGVSINSKGVVFSGGSNGATSHTFEEYFIDPDGRTHFLYGVNTEYNPISFYWDEKFFNLPDDLYQDQDAELLEYYFEPGADQKRDHFLVLETGGEENSEERIPDHPVRKVLEKEGVFLTSASEMRNLIEERDREAGFDRSMENAQEPEWFPVNR